MSFRWFVTKLRDFTVFELVLDFVPVEFENTQKNVFFPTKKVLMKPTGIIS